MAEVDKQTLHGDRPVVVPQHVLDAAAYSPARAGGAFRLVEANKSGRTHEGIFNAAYRQATRRIQQRVVADHQSGSGADRAQPCDLVRKCLATVAAISEGGSRSPTRKPGDVPLQAENKVAVLPVVSDLTSADEPARPGTDTTGVSAASVTNRV